MADFVFDPLALAYAAGLMDGEGTFGITEYAPGKDRKSPQFRCYVAVVTSDLVLPFWMAESFGGTVHTYEGRQPSHKPFSRWSLQNRRAAEFASVVAPYLRLKGPQARLLSEFYADPRFVFKQRQGIPDAEVDARREYVTQVHVLNKRGA